MAGAWGGGRAALRPAGARGARGRDAASGGRAVGTAAGVVWNQNCGIISATGTPTLAVQVQDVSGGGNAQSRVSGVDVAYRPGWRSLAGYLQHSGGYLGFIRRRHLDGGIHAPSRGFSKAQIAELDAHQAEAAASGSKTRKVRVKVRRRELKRERIAQVQEELRHRIVCFQFNVKQLHWEWKLGLFVRQAATASPEPCTCKLCERFAATTASAGSRDDPVVVQD